MSRCKATKKFKISTKGQEFELSCDLDDNHMNILGFHYDKFNDVEWRNPLQPVGVPSTRTSPTSKPNRAKASVAKSVTAHTGVFDVIAT